MSGTVVVGDRWEFTSPPRILAVEDGSPAARAGLRTGDLLTHIDGVPLTSDAGSEQLAAVAPGQTVEWTYRRDGEQRTATMTVDTRPPPPVRVETPPHPRPDRPPPARDVQLSPPPPAARDNTVRFSGDFAGADVTVRGPATTVVLYAEQQCVLEIRTSDTVIRLAAPGKCDGRPDPLSEPSEKPAARARASSAPSAK
jgi:hypothetical protein